MSARRRSLGAHLALLVTLSTLLAMCVFTGVAALVVALDEMEEADQQGAHDDTDEAEDTPFDEVIEDLGFAVLVATPIGIVVALVGARWAARRVTARIDALIASASRMTAANLGERLPRSDEHDELDDLVAALNALFARIDDGIAALRSFAADASHELRTPLAVTINALEVARRRPRTPAEWEQVTDETLDELRRMAELTEALLQTARAGAFDLAGDPIEVDDELEPIATQWRPAAESAGVTLALAPGAGAGAAVRIDPRGLAMALGNLVSNAIAHSPRGGTVTMRTVRRADRLRVEVDDQGPGVPAEHRARIFDPFERGDGADRPGRAGVGLGLSISRRIVEAHHGTIAVADAPGGGARFVVEFPVIRAPS